MTHGASPFDAHSFADRDADGRVIDAHALRRSFVARLGTAGVPIVVAHWLARHSTPTLTANAYTHVGIADERAALRKALAPSEPPESARAVALATGTDDAKPAQRAQQRLQRLGRDALRFGATAREATDTTPREGASSHALRIGGVGDTARGVAK